MNEPVAASGRTPTWRWLEATVVAFLLLNAMDLASDSWPTLRNEAFPLREPEAEREQYYLLAWLWVWLGARSRSIVAAIRALPLPRPVLAAIGLIVTVEATSVAFHVEVFPFSHVGMFSFVEPAPEETWWMDGWYVHDQRGERVPFSYFRPGDPWLAAPFSLDGRAAWITYEHRGRAGVRAQLEERLTAQGLVGPPVHERWRVRTRDMQVVERWDPRTKRVVDRGDVGGWP